MQPEAYDRLAARDAHYWWYRARRVLGRLLLQRFGARKGTRAIDIGCGPGGNLALFDCLAPSLVVGLDLSPIALDYVRRTQADAVLVRADLSTGLPLADGVFEIATLFNVLYHDWVDDDQAALRRIARLLKPGGLLLLTEPAFAVLRRGLDRAVMGNRRYNRRKLFVLAAAAGFDVLLCSYFCSFGFPWALLAAMADHLRFWKSAQLRGDFRSIDFTPLRADLNEKLFRIASVEARQIAAGRWIPFGVGVVAVLRRKGPVS